MWQARRTFRIFVSSTFGDLKAERNGLQAQVFPKLRELCRRHGCRFQAIDLRWGVREEAALDQQTMRICLDEIARCRRVTPRPNFLLLLGDRYGWRPLPFAIPANEFATIEARVLDAEERTLLHRWYRRDDNAVPPIWNLQPRTGDLVVIERWEPIERGLRAILAVATAEMPADVRFKYLASATEQEVTEGALAIPDADQHVFAFFRGIRGLPHDPTACEFVDIDDVGQLDREAQVRLEALKERLRDRLPGHVHDFTATWRATGPTIDHLGTLPDTLEECLLLTEAADEPKTLCMEVWRALSRTILAQIDQFEAEEPLMREVRAHAVFGRDRAKGFVGRETTLQMIADYVGGAYRQPLVVWGAPGSGKTSLMGEAVARWSPSDSDGPVISRFIGATPGSSDGRTLLEGLCRQLARRYGADEAGVPAEYQKLVQDFPERLELATSDRPLVVFLDALDQLSDADHARDLAWLPTALPPNVRLVVSTVAGSCLDAARRRLPPASMVELTPLSRAEGEALLDSWLQDVRRTLQPPQRREVLDKFALTGLPLHLKLAFEQARHWNSHASNTVVAADVQGVIEELFARLSDDANHGRFMVERSLAYLCAARRGLSEDELLDVLSRDEAVFSDFIHRARHEPPERRLPVVVWSRLSFDLEPYLSERDVDGTSLLVFYHRQLREAAEATFLAVAERRVQAHGHLADYFAEQELFREPRAAQRRRARALPPTPRPVNQRKVNELPWQLSASARWSTLEDLLTDIEFIQAKIEAGLLFDLLGDYDGMRAIVPPGRPRAPLLRVLEDGLRSESNFIADHPTAAFQCLWNHGWWWDCPQLERHYESSPEGGDSERARLGVSNLVEEWRITLAAEGVATPWVRAHRPSPTRVGSLLFAVLRGHEDEVGDVAWHPSGTRVASVSRDGTVRIWDVATAGQLRRLGSGLGSPGGVAWSPDGAWIASGHGDRTVRVWDHETGEQRWCLRGHEDFVTSVAVSPDQRWIASGSGDRTIRVWEVSSGTEFRRLSDHEYAVTSVAWSPDGVRLVSGSWDGTVRLWDALDPVARLLCLRGHKNDDVLGVRSVAWSSDGRFVFSASSGVDAALREWEVAKGTECRRLRGSDGKMECIAVTDDGRRIAGGGSDQAIHVWDVGSGAVLNVLHGHASDVTSVAWSPDGTKMASGSRDKTIRIWNPSAATAPGMLRGHHGIVLDVKWSHNGSRIASAGGVGDCTARMWDSDTGLQVACLRAHDGSVRSVAWSPDDRLIASGGEDRTIRIWDVASAREVLRLQGHEGGVLSLDWSPEGGRLASGGSDGTVRTWDCRGGVELSSLRGHQGDVQVVAWSPDNAKIASGGSSDGTARIWDVATGRELHRLAHNDVGVWSLAWNPDGTRIYSWAGDRTMRTWDAAKGTCLEENRESSAEFGDLVAQARGAERHPYRAFATKNGSVIQEAVSGRAIAWYPVDLVLASSPSGRAWGGGDGNDLYILGLEGIDYAGPPSSGGENRRESGERRDPPTSQPRWSRWTRWLGWKKK